MTDDFKDYPKTINEIKSDRSFNAADWKPRDALITLLRSIDSGEENPDFLIIAYGNVKADGVTTDGYYSTSPNLFLTLGLLEKVKLNILKFILKGN